MSDDQDKNRCFGQSEGLARRLAMWANSLSRNKDYPWIGLGIVSDLKAAAQELGCNEDPNEFYTHRAPAPKAVEYDL